MITATPMTKKYFENIKQTAFKMHQYATDARKKGYDPEDFVEIKLAENLAERVIGLISIVAPQITNSGAIKRIMELEKEFGPLDWRVAMKIALEIAQEKLCAFKSKIEAMEVGIRTGFAYVTLGVVSAPLEGFIGLELKDRLDGRGKYMCLNYAGPIRAAGGTSAAVSVLIGDYVRKNMGYDVYDPTEKEVQRCRAELEDYHEYVANLQYFPSKHEAEFMLRNIPVEIGGDPSEKYEISSALLKDLPRVPTNLLRSGYCLIHSACLPLKAPKIWVKLKVWGKEMGMEHWDFLSDFIILQTRVKSAGKKEKENAKITPDYTYIKDLVGGRPVLGHPLKTGAFRLRYGRARTSGYSGQAVHPATMILLNNFVATGTQLKVERPGKAAAYSACDSIDGPIIKLKKGDVVYVDNETDAKKYKDDVEEIIYAGDVLINYGDFFDRAHRLVPPGYCEEIWIQEFETAANELIWTVDPDKLSELLSIESDKLWALKRKPLSTKISFFAAKEISLRLEIPLHPKHIYYWNAISKQQLKALRAWVKTAKLEQDKLILENNDAKRHLEIIGLPHKFVNKEYVIVEKDCARSLIFSLGLDRKIEEEEAEACFDSESVLEVINRLCLVVIKDKCGTFIGSRMGRPEKAKMRRLTGSPHVLFPVGEEGGRLRNFHAAIKKGKIVAEIKMFRNEKTNRMTPFRIDEKTGAKTVPVEVEGKQNIMIGEIMESMKKKLGDRIIPDLIKGVRGTSNKEHIAEHLLKGILRAKWDIYVNKDGTVRYDCSEIALTHFKPGEIGTTIEKLKELGYTHDIKGISLTNDDQVLELKVQDLLLPCSTTSPDEPANEILFRTSRFVDEELQKLYGMKPFYNLATKEELVGHLVIGLAPHTSAGIVARIIGFSKTQAFLAHPYVHAAMRRDCFVHNTIIPIKKGVHWELANLGEVVDGLNPTDVVDDFGTKEIKVKGYKTIGLRKGKLVEVKVKNFTKHAPMGTVEIKTSLGRLIKTTINHKHVIVNKSGNKDKIVRAGDIKKGDFMKLPYIFDVSKKNVRKIDLLEELKFEEWVMVKGLSSQTKDMRPLLRKEGVSQRSINNYVIRDSVPLSYAKKIISVKKIDKSKLFVSAKRDSVRIPAIIDVNEYFLKILGLYVAEGYSRKKQHGKGFYQIYISADKPQIRSYIKNYFMKFMGLKPSENKQDRVTYSSRVIYHLFSNILGMGSSAYEKRMPSKFLNLPNQKLGWILSGYLEGDGSVSRNDLRISFDTVSRGLLKDIDFIMGQFGIFVKNKEYTKKPGPKLREFYHRKNRPVPEFTIVKGTIQSKFVERAAEFINFISDEKKAIFEKLLKTKKYRYIRNNYTDNYFIDEVVTIRHLGEETTYCLNVENNIVVANGILTRQCDGDESCILLLMDAFLNFSQKFLPSSRGSAMDAPLVLTSTIIPAEVDDMVFNVDIVWRYPLEFYRAAEQYKMPFDVKVKRIDDVRGTPDQYENMGFTHPTKSINAGVTCSAYKLLPSMAEKVDAQMDLAVKLRAVDERDVAKLIINKHFIRDTKGNLRKFSLQQFRCVACNEKYRRPPLSGKCDKCGGKIIFTISEGSIVKYINYCKELAEKYDLDDYTKQTIDLTIRRIEGVFGREKEIQMGLGAFE